MKNFKLHAAVFTVGLMSFVYLAAPAVADEWDKMTTFHFNAPVEVPGHVLTPGTYVFKLADLTADRNVVQVFSQDRRGMDHIITTTITVPAYRMYPAGKTILTFQERRSDSPEAVDKWFYPGDNYGFQFVYPKSETLEAAANVIPAPAPVAPPPAASVTPQPAPEAQAAPPAAEQPQPPAVAQNEAPAPPAPSQAEPNANRQAPTELPKTASDFTLALVIGLSMLGVGATLLGFAGIRNRA
jgi:outer membrane biosynthesis protein TonB